ncbi:MAG: hypothetical protein A2Y73_07470 [Chloroflexi bacterium RBG_13_56_8]|nr:MAG: hypothetical protein A2Y73_07470 [Chloroflexi bacterium RBG_13_56_8]
MTYNKRLYLLLAILMVIAMAVGGCARVQALDKEINLNLGAEPPTLDPALTTDRVSINCTESLFMGLTNLDEETVEVLPELATKWDVSEDGLTWTFKMREDVQWVHYDPATQKTTEMGPVTAHDVEYAVKRTLNPETASDYAYVDYIIKNGQAVNSGESTDLDSIGVRAVNDFTVEFTLEQPAGYFPAIAGLWVNRPMPQQVIGEFGDQWTEPGNLWTTGAYVLDTWEHENKMVFLKNPYWYDAKDVSIERVNYVMVEDASTSLAMYEAGELDVTDVPVTDMDRIRTDAQLSQELYIGEELSSIFYGFNTTKPPFDQTEVRQAFSLAMDREKVIETVAKGGQKPAKTFAPPGIFGSPAGDPGFVGAHFDPGRAKQLLAEAGYPDGNGLPQITLMYPAVEDQQKMAEFFQQSWKEILGVEVELASQEWRVYVGTVIEDAPQIYAMGWNADYPDENNWVLEIFHPTMSTNEPKWNPELPAAKKFMSVTEEAASSGDPEERKELYFEAEKILVEDEAIIAPVYYDTTTRLTKPYVQRTYAMAGGEQIQNWKVLAH